MTIALPCPLPLVSLRADETCPRCGHPAREHRGHPTYQEETMETIEPTREWIEQRIAQIEGMLRWPEPAVGWETDLAVCRMALRTMDAEAQLATMTEKYRKQRDRHDEDGRALMTAHKRLAAMTERAERAERERDSCMQVEACTKAFHDLAVKERDYDRVRADRLERELAEARETLAAMTARAEKAERALAAHHALPSTADHPHENQSVSNAELRRLLYVADRDRDRYEAELKLTKQRNIELDEARAKFAEVERERDEARALLVQRGMEIDALVSEKRDAVEAFHDATRLRSQIQAARVKAEDERDAAIARAEAALCGESEAVRRAESAELGCEIAYRREPTQAEGDAHESDHGCDCCEDDCQRCAHLAPLAIKSGECFVPMGGWTGRRCRRCRRWAWGGPTTCEACAAFEAGRDRAEAAEKRAQEAERERDAAVDRAKAADRLRAESESEAISAYADRDHWRTVAESRPDISREDAARCAWNVCGNEPQDADAAERIEDALEAHATAPKDDASEAERCPKCDDYPVPFCTACNGTGRASGRG